MKLSKLCIFSICLQVNKTVLGFGLNCAGFIISFTIINGFQMFFFSSHQLYASQARAELNFGSSLYPFLPYITDLYMFELCSNIEDISRDAGSVDIEEDTLDSMF
jgi:hypothetical protein